MKGISFRELFSEAAMSEVATYATAFRAKLFGVECKLELQVKIWDEHGEDHLIDLLTES